MMNLFLDTGFIIALEVTDDQNHQAAFSFWRSLESPLPKIITTSYVFDEMVTFFNSRNLHYKAVEVGNRLLDSPSVELIQVDEKLFFQGWQYFKNHQDKSYSLTDCISFVVMEQRHIPEALTFDKHFNQAGFRKLPN